MVIHLVPVGTNKWSGSIFGTDDMAADSKYAPAKWWGCQKNCKKTTECQMVAFGLFSWRQGDGRTYESELNGYSSSFYEGKKINIYYDKNNPNKIGMKSLDFIFLMFPGFGLIFLSIGGTGLLLKNRNKKLEKSLKENGDVIYADYVETIVNSSYRVNGRHPYRIICEWNNPLDSKKYIFKSKNIWINPENTIIERNIKQFPVYINRNDIKKYFVDIDIFENKEG